MNRDITRAIEIIIDFKPDVWNILQEYKEIEFQQAKQFKTFVKAVSVSPDLEDFHAAKIEFLTTNNYLLSKNNVNYKQLFEDLYDDLEDFNNSLERYHTLYNLSLHEIIKSKGLFRNTLTNEKVNSFIEGIGYLNSIRNKCICYIATFAFLNIGFSFFPDESTRIALLEEYYGFKPKELPNRLDAMKYMQVYIKSGFFISK